MYLMAERRSVGAPAPTGRDGADDTRAAAGRAVLAVVDVRVAGWLDLVGAIAPSCQVDLVDPGEDGLVRVAEALEAAGAVERMVVVALGSPGAIRLGGSDIDVAAVQRSARLVGRIREALRGAAVELHTGTATTGPEGRRLVESLAAALGTSVSASVGAGAGCRAS